jgi:phage shock protein PspC (stress-responsive transcriptional regulator)
VKRLQKSATIKMLFGVAGGVGEYFGIDPVLVRIVFVALAFANGIGILLYLLLALIMPKPHAATEPPMEVVRQNVRGISQDVSEAGRRVADVVRGKPRTEESVRQPGSFDDEKIGAGLDDEKLEAGTGRPAE